MADSFPTRDQIRAGSRVRIETKENQGTGTLIDGIVDEILTSAKSHPHGIKVRLKDGQIGRVKKIVKKHFERDLQENTSTSDQTNFQVTPAPNISKSSTISGFIDLDKKTIPKTEDTKNEFKEFYQYDTAIDSLLHNADKSKTINKIKHSVQERLAIAVCSFGNGRTGGFVYIGINSKGTVLGLENDRKLGGFSDYNDSFANHIRDSLGNFIKDRVFLTSKLQMKFRKAEEKTICIVRILPSDKPLYVNTDSEKKFFVRGIAPRAEKLDAEEQYRYIKDRFPNY